MEPGVKLLTLAVIDVTAATRVGSRCVDVVLAACFTQPGVVMLSTLEIRMFAAVIVGSVLSITTTAVPLGWRPAHLCSWRSP